MLQQISRRWWGTMKPYCTRVYQEVWFGLACTSYMYYKISYGGKSPCFNLRLVIPTLKSQK
uniref:Uncharacterized protein n=1 Tax=Crocodylus porosus TaxID=8502 RepID=A0A7M4FC70_CROPO